ncbi:MAG: DinB family protein [Chloroflexota bacterium]
MSKLELLRDLYDYNEYASNALLDVAAFVELDDVGNKHATSLRDVVANMAHIVAAQINWLERWKTGFNTYSTAALAGAMGTVGKARMAADRSHADLRAYIGTLAEADLDRDLAYKDSHGSDFAYPLWQLLTHVANHGTYHRGEVAAALTAIGHSPGELDFLYWLEGR